MQGCAPEYIHVEMITVGQPCTAGHVCFPEKWWIGSLDTIYSTIRLWFTLSILTSHWHLHPLQAANRCRNFRLVVDEDDLMWFKN